MLRAFLRAVRGFDFFLFVRARVLEEASGGLGKTGAAKAGCDRVATHNASKPTTVIPVRLIQIHLRYGSILSMTLLLGKGLSVHPRGVYAQTRGWPAESTIRTLRRAYVHNPSTGRGPGRALCARLRKLR